MPLSAVRYALLVLSIAAIGAPALAQRPGPGGQVPASVVPAGPQQDAGQSSEATWLPRLVSWVTAVRDHRPGEADIQAIQIGTWSEAELLRVRTDLFTLIAAYEKAARNRLSESTFKFRGRYFTRGTAAELLGMDPEAATRADVDGLLRRAAVLHADVEMLVLPFGLSRPPPCNSSRHVLVQDGQMVGQNCTGIHWAEGRALLDGVKPEPGLDPIVRLWYYASIVYMLEQGDFSNANRQIEHCRPLFPDDPAILFEHGYYHEAFASPLVQPVAQAWRVDLRSPETHLREAESLYRGAVKTNPDFLEARAHHGRVLDVLGRHEDAAAVLRAVAGLVQGQQLRYLSAIFLGDAEQAAGNRDAARIQYERARAVYPGSQSPHLALALLAHRGGDRAGAQRALRELLDLPPEPGGRLDPWWAYYRWQNQTAEDLFRALARSVGAGSAR